MNELPSAAELLEALRRDFENQSEADRKFIQSNIVMAQVQPILDEQISGEEKVFKIDALSKIQGFENTRDMYIFRQNYRRRTS